MEAVGEEGGSLPASGSAAREAEARRQSPCALYSMGVEAGSCRMRRSASRTRAAAAVSAAVLCQTAR